MTGRTLQIALPLLILAITGCARPQYGLDACLAAGAPPAAGEATVQSLRYRVRTDAGKAAALEVSRFMERAAALWTPLLGVPNPSSLPLDVRLHRDPGSLARVLADQKMTVRATGLYLSAPPPAIHLACRGDEPGHPYRTLLHEGTHQFIHLGAGYREPGQPPTAPPRLAFPLWLNEGLAIYYETAFITPDILQPGHPDPARLAELQEALRRGRAPALDDLLSRRYGEPFNSLDYAVAWGVVYALMQESPPPWASGGRQWLKELIDGGRRGWPGAAVAAKPLSGADPWWGLVTISVRSAFEAFAAERATNVAGWEAAWRAWILAHP